MRTNLFPKTLICSALLGLFAFSHAASAKTFTLEQGQSQLIKTDAKIDTVFVSSPDVADYEILDDNTFMLYAKAEGRAEIVAFDVDGTPLTEDFINVNNTINNIAATNEQIQTRFPNSNLSVKKIGKAYVIEGKAKNAAESEEINRIVGESLGAGKKVIEAKLKLNESEEDVPFLDKYQYEGVINNAKEDDATQINVKLTVAEVNKTFSDEIGINWSNLSGNFFRNLGNASISGGFGTGGGQLALVNSNNLNVLLSALDNQNNGKILAEPNISMLSGETADILVGGEVPFVQRNKDGELNVLYKDFGIKLAVGAKVQKSDRIRLLLSQSVSTIAGNYEIDDNHIPIFNTRRSKSTFEVGNGESFIISGLLNKQDIEGIKKVPFLGDVPILGAFFRSANSSRESKELVVVATVNLVKPVDGSQVLYPTFENTGTMERFFNSTSLKNVYHKTLTSNFLKNGGFIQ
ncbi:type II and III secretion system protein family protein [Actinobacillus equuli]|uniref:Rough colony protein A n=1 Tax=Actinobacillus equuli TaxID=718 RepID=A0AAX3FHS4_ACTEU|nr:type II and III secretion system protein family protein [Actinobacillus equuli]AIZ79020.1 secretin [Actinobacillus equuli subsp. equuli]WGE45266.1 type II and III secretion system protein family protein [Actinobacillus equuli subsp. equuli]VEE89106.1 rough colony protein A [Actinobacillus equuli]